MEVKSLQKMKLKKTTISRINQATSMLVKGGTRSSNATQVDDSALISHCAALVCY